MESKVEDAVLEGTGKQLKLPDEKIPVIIVDNFPMLGKLAALRFLEWTQDNPEGTVSLPTGKTPEHFIKNVIRLRKNWQVKAVREELEGAGIDPLRKPDFAGLKFVQIDEFYPINPRHHNSFYHYIRKYYIDGFGLSPDRALLINCEDLSIGDETPEGIWGDDGVDLSLRYRNPKNRIEEKRKLFLEKADQWCDEYEDAIRAQGGIGFFLGGIGPDGHIGFNIRGSSLYSTTRLTETNYETQAASAQDLGGIEVAKKRLVITIGLSTITYNPACVAIIMAAGEAKAPIVADAIMRERDVLYPASCLQILPAARFYITTGAACRLKGRKLEVLSGEQELSRAEIERIVIEVSLASQKTIESLTRGDYENHWLGKILPGKAGKPLAEIHSEVIGALKNKLTRGINLQTSTRFLHTEPHHDDIMLGYLPFVVRHIREHSNHHHFATLTSGFTSVTNDYMLDVSRRMRKALAENKFGLYALLETGYFTDNTEPFKDHDVYTYLDGLAAQSAELMEKGTLFRFLRDLITVYEETDLDNLRSRLDELINYFETQYPGKKDLPYIQKLKGMCREWESACLWGYFGWNSSSVEHLRLGFYTGDIFMEEPSMNRDVQPIFDLLNKVRPDVVTVAFDPEASGPDTHYKVMQSISEALKLYEKEEKRRIEVIGYRNVWYRFHPSEADIFVPVSLNMLTLQHESFMNTYISQKDASFPSYEFDGPFSLLAQKIQVSQYDMLVTCLGRDYFYEHESALIRATRGFVFLRSMELKEFFAQSRDLKKMTENR